MGVSGLASAFGSAGVISFHNAKYNDLYIAECDTEICHEGVKMKNKPLTTLLCVALTACSLTGCNPDNSLSEATVGSSSAVETMDPPEDGWTENEILSVTYLCGRQLSYPLTITSLGEGFELGEGTEKVYERSIGQRVDAELWYKKERLALVALDAETIEEVNNDTRIYAIYIDDSSAAYMNSDGNISLNGISVGDSIDKLEDTLGSPSSHNEKTFTCTYNMRNDPYSKIVISYDKERRIQNIVLLNI